MRVAILGTGKMGGAMARRLHSQGHELTLWNRTRERAEALRIGTVAATPGGQTYSQEQLDAIVAQRVQQQLEAERARKSSELPPHSQVVVRNVPQRNPAARVTRRDGEVAGSIPSQKSRRPLSKTEREQLAADLRLTSAKNDSDFDLLGDRINQ